MNAATALSMSSSLCAALTCTRMRALPIGTTYKKGMKVRERERESVCVCVCAYMGIKVSVFVSVQVKGIKTCVPLSRTIFKHRHTVIHKYPHILSKQSLSLSSPLPHPPPYPTPYPTPLPISYSPFCSSPLHAIPDS